MDRYASTTERDGEKAYETIFEPKRYRREEGDLLSSRVADVSGHKDMPAIGQAVAGRPDNTQAAAQLGVPTIVIHGKDDAAIPIKTGVQVANRIPHAKMVRLPAVGHCPPLEAPSAVAAEVIQLAEVALFQ